MHFVSTSIYKKAKVLALSEGLNPKIFESHHNHPSLLGSEPYVPIEFLFELYETSDDELSPGFSVRQVQQLFSKDYGTLGLAWRTCWYAKDIFQRLLRFMVLVTDHVSAELIEGSGSTELFLDRKPFEEV